MTTLVLVAALALAAAPRAQAATPSSPVAGLQVAWSAQLRGAVTGRVIVAGDRAIAATAADEISALAASTGTVLWTRSVGRSEPAGPGQPFPCTDVTPLLGVLSTPVVDMDRHVVFVSARDWDGSSPASARWVLHALSLETGREAVGWPVPIEGTAANAPATKFDPVVQLQRPELVLTSGHVVVAFGGACDTPPFQGWIATVDEQTAAMRLWTDEASPSVTGGEGGIWQAGGPPARAGDGSLYVATGNGSAPPAGPAAVPAPNLANSVLHLSLDATGGVAVRDRFTPPEPQALEAHDLDLGAGAPLLLDAGFAGSDRALVIQTSKAGRVYVLDSTALGGEASHEPSSALAESQVEEAAFTRPAALGDAGLLFVVGTVSIQPPQPLPTLRAWRLSRISDRYALTLVASAATAFGFASGSPVVTTGARPLIWLLERPFANEASPELRAYDAVPHGEQLTLVHRLPVPGLGRFAVLTLDGPRLLLATAEGRVEAVTSPDLVATTPAGGRGAAIELPTVLLLVGAAAGTAAVWRHRKKSTDGGVDVDARL